MSVHLICLDYNKMLKEEELELLYRHLNSSEEILEKACEPLLNMEPSSSEPIFRWQCCLLNYLILNVIMQVTVGFVSHATTYCSLRVTVVHIKGGSQDMPFYYGCLLALR